MENIDIIQQKVEVLRVLSGITQMKMMENTKELHKIACEKQIEIIKSIKFE